MDKNEKLKAMQAGINYHESAIVGLKLQRDEILMPAFNTQHKMAYAISEEPQYKEHLRHFSWKSPLRWLTSMGVHDEDISWDNGNWYLSTNYGDGEHANDARLLPEFIDGSEELQQVAIRTVFDQFLKSEEQSIRNAEARKIEEAKATLAKAGITLIA